MGRLLISEKYNKIKQVGSLSSDKLHLNRDDIELWVFKVPKGTPMNEVKSIHIENAPQHAGDIIGEMNCNNSLSFKLMEGNDYKDSIALFPSQKSAGIVKKGIKIEKEKKKKKNENKNKKKKNE